MGILFVLKIIGIVLLAILALALLLVALVFLLPARYRVVSYSKGKSIDIKVKATWLLHIISFEFILHNTYNDTKCKIFGYDILANKSKDKSKKKNKHIHEDKDATAEESTGVTKDDIKEEDISFTDPSANIQNADYTPIPNKKQTLISKIFKLVRMILSIPGKIVRFFAKINYTIASICDKINDTINYVKEQYEYTQSKTFKSAFDTFKKDASKILHHIRPRRLKLDLNIGFKDPANTGLVVGFISSLYPSPRRGVKINAYYDKTILEYDLKGKGHIRLASVLSPALDIKKNQEIKDVIAHFKEQKERINGTK